jgi:DNA-binding response OmpR family regulator
MRKPAAFNVASHGTVLVIEDDPDTRESLALLFALAGLQVATAANADHGIAIAAAAYPRCLILDLGLPDRSGIEVLRELRSRSPADDLVVIVLTGWCDPAHEELARAAGCDHFVRKPAEFPSLLALAEAAMQRKNGCARKAASTRAPSPAM